jgi:hypothetical protein
MKKLAGILVFCIIASAAYAADSSTHKTLQQIADNADVGNGETDLTTYNASSLNLAAAISKDLNQVKKDFPDCGPFKTTQYRRESIDALRKESNDSKTADALSDLYRQGKIAKIYSITTNIGIDCSRMWVRVYTTDGELLKIYYGMND